MACQYARKAQNIGNAQFCQIIMLAEVFVDFGKLSDQIAIQFQRLIAVFRILNLDFAFDFAACQMG